MENSTLSKQHKETHIALDFDGTLAQYDSWDNQFHKVGEPIPLMIHQLKEWLAKGYKVSIFTARLSHSPEEAAQAVTAITGFLKDNGLPELPITHMKMHYFTHFVDDKAYHAVKNIGVISPSIEFYLK